MYTYRCVKVCTIYGSGYESFFAKKDYQILIIPLFRYWQEGERKREKDSGTILVTVTYPMQSKYTQYNCIH